MSAGFSCGLRGACTHLRLTSYKQNHTWQTRLSSPGSPQKGQALMQMGEQSPGHQQRRSPAVMAEGGGPWLGLPPMEAAGGLCTSAGPAMVLTYTGQLGPCSHSDVSSPLSLCLLPSGRGQTLPREGWSCLARPGLTTSKLFHGLIWEDTSVCAILLAQFKDAQGLKQD